MIAEKLELSTLKAEPIAYWLSERKLQVEATISTYRLQKMKFERYLQEIKV